MLIETKEEKESAQLNSLLLPGPGLLRQAPAHTRKDHTACLLQGDPDINQSLEQIAGVSSTSALQYWPFHLYGSKSYF